MLRIENERGRRRRLKDAVYGWTILVHPESIGRMAGLRERVLDEFGIKMGFF